LFNPSRLALALAVHIDASARVHQFFGGCGPTSEYVRTYTFARSFRITSRHHYVAKLLAVVAKLLVVLTKARAFDTRSQSVANLTAVAWGTGPWRQGMKTPRKIREKAFFLRLKPVAHLSIGGAT
jgi:hypothetical protein